VSAGSEPAKRRPGQAGDARTSQGDDLDMRAPVEGPSTTTPHPTTSREQPGCAFDLPPTRSQPVGDALPGPPDRSTPGDDRLRVLHPDYIAMDPEQWTQAVRALTELILTWTKGTHRAMPADLDLDEAA
jgi:hypothetical protein